MTKQLRAVACIRFVRWILARFGYVLVPVAWIESFDRQSLEWDNAAEKATDAKTKGYCQAHGECLQNFAVMLRIQLPPNSDSTTKP